MQVPTIPDTALPRARQEAELRQKAVAFEAAFLAEMLGHAGIGDARSVGGGGAGEDAFASLLAREQAEGFARAGGIGLADRIYESLVRRSGGADG